MLKHPTLDLLGQLGLAGMAQAFTDLAANDCRWRSNLPQL